MESIQFIEDLAAVMIAAGIFGSLCKRIGLSVIVGYLAAGIVLGPYTPPFAFVHDLDRIHTLSQLGLVFLMFAIGLELSLNKLRKLGPSMGIAAALGAFFVFNLTQLLGSVAGWTRAQTMFTAAMLMVSSSAVIAKMLRDLQLEHERAGQQALGIAVMEDIVAIVMLTLLGSYTKASGAEASGAVTTVLTGLSGFVVLIVMGALLFVPRLLRRLQARADPELQTIVIAGVLLLLAVAAVWAGYSLALGAFLLGAVVAELPQRHQVEHAFEGVKDIFSSVFFVSIGMLIDVHLVADVWPWILGLGAFVLVARPLSVGLALVLTGTPPAEARRAGLCMSPLGEFSFIIAQLGVEAGVLPKTHYTLAVGMSLVTVLAAPLINRRSAPLLRWIEAHEPGWLRHGLHVYHGWLAQLAAAPGKRLWWRRSRSHVIQIVIEWLFVTGLFLFAETIYRTLEHSHAVALLNGPAFRILFWLTFGLLTLLPLIGMFWSISAVARVIGESLQARTGRLVATVLQLGATAVVVVSLWYLVPGGLLPARIWWIVGGVLAVLVGLFSQRLISLRSQMLGSVEEVLEGTPERHVPSRWGQPSEDWALNLQEIELPRHALCAGKTIAALMIRRRFGCTIVEINRQGYVLAGPEPSVPLFPGDRLLVLGSGEQIAAARLELVRENASDEEVAAFDDAQLASVTVPDNPQIIGRTLRSLRIPHRTGAVVVGIERQGLKLANPSGDEIAEPGDHWLVIGAAEELRSLRALLSGEDDSADGRSLEPSPGAAPA
jgi:CPA2 family monovalent cation:H+ antiporter-2